VFLLQKNLSNLEDELAVKKMAEISKKIKEGTIKTLTEKQVKKKYNLK